MHRNVGMEVVYVSQGRPCWTVDGQREYVPAGAVFFTLPWQSHGSEYVHEPGNRIHFVQFRLDRDKHSSSRSFGFHPSLGVPAVDAKRMSRVLSGTTRHSWPASPTLEWLILALVERLEAGGPPLLIRGLFLGMVSELVDVISQGDATSPVLNPTERRVQKLVGRLNLECADAWALPRMMACTRLGATQLTAIFKHLTGDSPVAYLKRARVMKAELLLVDTQRPITEIAMDCGFTTTQMFCRIFKQYTNRTPTQYRHERRGSAQRPVHVWSNREEQERHDALHRHEWI